MPEIDIGPAFAAAADAALNTTLKPSFSPYASNLLFLHGMIYFCTLSPHKATLPCKLHHHVVLKLPLLHHIISYEVGNLMPRKVS